jgi:DNA-binding transcriptional LysR family regulator
LGVKLFVRQKGEFHPTDECQTVIRYAKRLRAIYDKMLTDVRDHKKMLTRLKVGITHTAESNLMAQVLAKYSSSNSGITMSIATDTIKNLYAGIENFELDLAIVWGKPQNPKFNSLVLDTDYLVCAVPVESDLAKQSMVTVEQLKKCKMILPLPSASTRMLFDSTLESIGENISNFDVVLEIDNIATIKDLIRKDMGVSVLSKSACMDEVNKGKMAILPIENLTMIRESSIIYHKNFTHTDVLNDITKIYRETVKSHY